MIAKAIFTENYEEIKEAERLELKKPEPIMVADDFLFQLESIEACHKTASGNIRIYFKSGSEWVIEFNEAIWDILKDHFKYD